MTPSNLFFWRRRKPYTSKRPTARRRVLELERLEDRMVPGQITQIQSFGSDFTDFINQPLAPAVQQFDTQNGTRILESVQIVVSSSLTTSRFGSITNNGMNEVATYNASVTNAMTSVSGPGLSSPVSNSASSLLTYGPVTIAPGTTLTIPLQTQTLSASGAATLTSPSDLAPFIGTGTLPSYITSASAVGIDNLSGSGNASIHMTITTTAQASVTVVYNFDPVDNAPEPSSLLLFSGLSLGLISFGGYRKLRARVRCRNLVTPKLPGSQEPDAPPSP